MPQETELAILFADVSGSTHLYEALGDVRARETVARCMAIMTDVVAKHGGRLVKTIGDEVMATFPSTEAVIGAAAQMQEEITGKLSVGGRQLAIHAGCHFGPVLVEGADVFGDAVNLASRMANQAKSGQILTTGETVTRMPRIWRASCRQIDRTQVKGRREPVDVFELVWQADDVTLLSDRSWANAPLQGGGELVLVTADRRIVVGEALPTVTVGRADQSDLVVNGKFVSRLHARIEYRNSRFTLTDQSVNGTYLVSDLGERKLVRRDSYVLKGSGVMGLGREPEPGATDAVRYEVKEQS